MFFGVMVSEDSQMYTDIFLWMWTLQPLMPKAQAHLIFILLFLTFSIAFLHGHYQYSLSFIEQFPQCSPEHMENIANFYVKPSLYEKVYGGVLVPVLLILILYGKNGAQFGLVFVFHISVL